MHGKGEMERLRGDMSGNLVESQVHPMQREVVQFQEHIGTPPEKVYAKFKEEAIETILEKEKSGFSEEMAMEACDTIIVALGLIHLAGQDFQELFEKKMAINRRKYALMPVYLAQGDSYEIAAARCKDLWSLHKEKETQK